MSSLNDTEKQELQTLQEERKTQHMSDSNRTRLSQLLAKEAEGSISKEGGSSGKKSPAGK